MAVVLSDIVQESATISGAAGAIVLGGAVLSALAFSGALADGQQLDYDAYTCDANGVPTGQREVGTGTYNAGPNTITRNTVRASTNGGAKVVFTGAQRVSLTIASVHSPQTDGPLSQFASTTSAQLAAVISDETGTGPLVFSNSPMLVTPTLGAATATSLQTQGLAQASISNVALTANIVTVTTGVHGFQVGQWVVIAAVTNTAINGVYQIASVPSGTTFTYALTHANIGSGADTGTADVCQRVVLNASGVVEAFETDAGQSVYLTTTSHPLVVRQSGGVAGTDELQIFADSGNGGQAGLYFPKLNAYLLSFQGIGGAWYITTGIQINGNGPGTAPFNTTSNNSNYALRMADGPGTGVMLGRPTSALGVSSGVWASFDLSGNPGWFQNSAGEVALASNFTNATATFASTALSFTLIAGRSYRIEGYLIASNSAAAEGIQIDFNGGTATATTFDIAANDIGSNVLGSAVSASLAGVINYTTITGTNRIWLRGYIKVNASGTFILRAAENSHAAGTLTLAAGSWLALADTINL